MSNHPGTLPLLASLLALAACEAEALERLSAPPTTTSTEESPWEDEAPEQPSDEPSDQGHAVLPVPTCNYYLLRPEAGQVAFFVDVEGVRWESVAVTVSDAELRWRLMQTGSDGTLSVPLDLSGRWSVEAMVLTPEGDTLPCGSLTAPESP